MKKIFSLVIFGLLTSTSVGLAMDKMSDMDKNDLESTLGVKHHQKEQEFNQEEYDDIAAGSVSASLKTYFRSIPDRDSAKEVLDGLLIEDEKKSLTTNQIRSVLDRLFDPIQDVVPTPGFDFNDFARKLAACTASSDQSKLLTQMEYEYGDPLGDDSDGID